ncbi:MAG TPA: hypothetical protein VLC47_13530 [Burkholderiales bacterium]|nr:hypothetical protein [Burkholderiales bacterium]
MLAFRILAVLVILLVGGALVTFLFTRDRRFLRFAWRVLKYGLVVAAVVLVLFALERIAIAG